MNRRSNTVNLQKYLPFFQHNVEWHCALALFSHDGKLIEQACEGGVDWFEKLIKNIENVVINNSNSVPELWIKDCGEDGAIIKIALQLPHVEESYWLIGLNQLPAGELISAALEEKTTKNLRNIANCIIDDYTLQLTLTGMVEELTVRYEELNLLYGLDDNDSHQLSMDERQAISQLISNCVDYMNVDLAVFYAPKLDISLHKLNSIQYGLDLNSILQNIQNSLYRYIKSTEKTLVINQNKDIDWTDANLKIFYKILAAPVMLSKENMAGLLVLIKTTNKPDFSNSDRKLCDVLASEAAKLIQARRDSITGLINRRGFTEKLQQAQALVKSYPLKFSLLFVDIDQFKVINDTSGQKAGDRLLNHIAGIIATTLVDHHTIGRLGADEFGVLLENHEAAQAEQTSEKICEAINKFRFSYEDKLFDISVCIGVAELNSESDDYSTTLSSAALACIVAKEQGRNRVHVYHPSDQDMIRHENEMHWVSRINLALEQERFLLYKQKILPLQGNPDSEEHYEILLRLKDENGNLVPPFNFIPAAERYNLMPNLDRWVVKTTLEKMANIIQKSPESKLSCSINLSGQSFCEPRFAEFIIDQINKTKVPTNRICLEITETAAVSNLSQTVKFIETLKSIGCSFSLDDFGSGMSSFTYLKTLPVDYLKIDGYFVKTMTTNAIDYAMVKSIHEIGHVMGLKTVAEFVENDDILQELFRLGVDYGQGYGIAKPEPFE